jgi:hypothetical protein
VLPRGYCTTRDSGIALLWCVVATTSLVHSTYTLRLVASKSETNTCLMRSTRDINTNGGMVGSATLTSGPKRSSNGPNELATLGSCTSQRIAHTAGSISIGSARVEHQPVQRHRNIPSHNHRMSSKLPINGNPDGPGMVLARKRSHCAVAALSHDDARLVS